MTVDSEHVAEIALSSGKPIFQDFQLSLDCTIDTDTSVNSYENELKRKSFVFAIVSILPIWRADEQSGNGTGRIFFQIEIDVHTDEEA